MRTSTFPVGHSTRSVPTEKLRRAFERSGVSKSELAKRMGYVRPNIDRLNRALGYRPDSNSRPPGVRKECRQFLSYDLAARLCEALQADPRECGL